MTARVQCNPARLRKCKRGGSLSSSSYCNHLPMEKYPAVTCAAHRQSSRRSTETEMVNAPDSSFDPRRLGAHSAKCSRMCCTRIGKLRLWASRPASPRIAADPELQEPRSNYPSTFPSERMSTESSRIKTRIGALPSPSQSNAGAWRWAAQVTAGYFSIGRWLQ